MTFFYSFIHRSGSEWYGWHFPELVKIIGDNYSYARLAKYIKNKSLLSEANLQELEELTLDEGKAKQILDAARSSMGMKASLIATPKKILLLLLLFYKQVPTFRTLT